MSINKNVVVQGKAIKLELDESGSLSNSFGKLNLEKTKNLENITYHSWNLQVQETTYAQEKDNGGRDEVLIMFNLSQDISWSYNFNTGSEQVQMSKGKVCVFRNNNYSTEMNYQAGANFVFKTLQMPTAYFQELLSKYFTDQKVTNLKEHFLSHVTITTITPEMYRVLSEIDTADRFKEYEGVYTEGKMIELTALVHYGIAYQKQTKLNACPSQTKTM